MGLFEYLFFFLPVVVWVFDRIGPRRRPAWLLFASLVFYAGVSPKRLPFLVGSIAFNYVVGRELGCRGGQRLLVLSVAANLLVLAGWGAVRLVVYNTPTADPASAPHIYPPGFLAEFNARLARLTTESAGPRGSSI